MKNLLDSDIEKLLDVLPAEISAWLRSRDLKGLIEIVLDYGRNPEARYLNSYETMDNYTVSYKDLDAILDNRGVSELLRNNRCGISGTLHRISCIRNKTRDVVGLTMRVGRVIEGTIDLIKDLIDTGESILLLGRPGVGKTSKLRDACKYLSTEKNQYVVIVDSSNEIAGDGDLPHPGVGRSRRMMVPFDRDQHEIMIEAVENHMPHVVVIDEISKEGEANAARTVAERGVQLIATAHGESLENLLKNKPLSTALLGKVSAHTLSDENAKLNGGRKTQLEREHPPTFTKLVELIDYDTVAIHSNVEKAIDCMLLGYDIAPEVRQMKNGKIIKLQEEFYSPPHIYVPLQPPVKSTGKFQKSRRRG